MGLDHISGETYDNLVTDPANDREVDLKVQKGVIEMTQFAHRRFGSRNPAGKEPVAFYVVSCCCDSLTVRYTAQSAREAVEATRCGNIDITRVCKQTLDRGFGQGAYAFAVLRLATLTDKWHWVPGDALDRLDDPDLPTSPAELAVHYASEFGTEVFARWNDDTEPFCPNC